MPHDCYSKAREIQRRTAIVLGLDAHDVVSQMCVEWGCQNADEFYARMRTMNDDELRAAVEGARRKVKGKKLVEAQVQEVAAYA